MSFIGSVSLIFYRKENIAISTGGQQKQRFPITNTPGLREGEEGKP